MNNEMYNVVNGESGAPAPAPTRAYTKYETVFAYLSIILGYLFCRTVPVGDNPLGALLLTALMFVCGTVFLSRRGAKQSLHSLVFLVPAVVFSLSLFLCENYLIHTGVLLWTLCSFVYWIYVSTGNAVAPVGDLTLLDFTKAALVMPWCSITSLIPASLGAGRGEQDRSERGKKILLALLWVALGLGIAIIPVFIVTALLSYDEGFRELLQKITDLPLDKVLSHIGSLILGIPLAFYGFGMLISDSDRKLNDKMTADGMNKFIGAIKFAPRLMVAVAVIPLLLIYVIFFISQGNYYLSAFTGVLPEGIDIYSSYARDGFFELCAVSAINAAVIAATALFTKPSKSGKPGAVQRVLSLLVSLSTLVLIATAVSKMILYIRVYGLTPLRVYTTWFMLLLAAAFILVIIRQIAPKFNFVAFLLAVFILFFGVLALSDVDGIIVRYNVDKYIDGTLSDFDSNALMDLGDDAVPEMLRLAEWLTTEGGVVPGKATITEALRTDGSRSAFGVRTEYSDLLNDALKATPKDKSSRVCEYFEILSTLSLYMSHSRESDPGVFSLTLPRLRADAALKPYLTPAS